METTRQRILLVEDEDQQREALSMVFESMGYEISGYESAELALTALAADVSPDIIITDVKLGGMDGVSFFEQVHADGTYRKIPFIFITGYNDPAAINRLKNLGATAYVTKPYDLESLLVLVRNALGVQTPI